MTETRFVMVSEWMEKGNINEFAKADIKADRLGLVCFFFRLGLLPLLIIGDHAITIADRRH